jgi:hypothetical protein
MLRKSILLLVMGGCLVLCGTAFQAKSVDISGDWEMTMTGGPGGGGPPEGGDMPPMVIHIVQKGDVLEVNMNNPMGEEMKGTGKIVGGEFEFTFTMNGPDGDMTIVHKGKVDGNTMKGTIAMGDRGEMQWSAKRVMKK